VIAETREGTRRMIRLLLLIAVPVIVYLWLRRGSSTGWAWLGRWLLPVALALLSLVYLRSPIDVIPDLSPIGFVDDVLLILGAMWWARRHLGAQGRSGGRGRGTKESRSGHWDPYEILGVKSGASAEEITQAYRRQMKRYHPDRVAELGEELQQVAHEKTLEIQRAYDELRS
jgi:uncharacterized membrane protein YkvA (DUF1232 family)